jgi:hypothetical protein
LLKAKNYGYLISNLIDQIKFKRVVITRYTTDLVYRAPKLIAGESKLPLDSIDFMPKGNPMLKAYR